MYKYSTAVTLYQVSDRWAAGFSKKKTKNKSRQYSSISYELRVRVFILLTSFIFQSFSSSIGRLDLKERNNTTTRAEDCVCATEAVARSSRQDILQYAAVITLRSSRGVRSTGGTPLLHLHFHRHLHQHVWRGGTLSTAVSNAKAMHKSVALFVARSHREVARKVHGGRRGG